MRKIVLLDVEKCSTSVVKHPLPLLRPEGRGVNTPFFSFRIYVKELLKTKNYVKTVCKSDLSDRSGDIKRLHCDLKLKIALLNIVFYKLTAKPSAGTSRT